MGKNYALRKKNGTTRIVQCDSNGNGGYFFKSDKRRCRGKVFTSKQKAKNALSKCKSKSSSFGLKKGKTDSMGRKLSYTVNIHPESDPMDPDVKYIVCPVRSFTLRGEKYKIAECGSGFDKTYHQLYEDAKTYRTKKAAKRIASDTRLAARVGTPLGDLIDPELLRNTKVITASGRFTSNPRYIKDLLSVFEQNNSGVRRGRHHQSLFHRAGIYSPHAQGTTGRRYEREDLGYQFRSNPGAFQLAGITPYKEARNVGRENRRFLATSRRRSRSSPLTFQQAIQRGLGFGMRRRRAPLNKIYGGRVNYGFSRYF